MTGNDILKNLQGADDKHIDETSEYKETVGAKAAPRMWFRWAAIAAAVVLAVTVAIVALTKKPAENIASLTDEPGKADRTENVVVVPTDEPEKLTDDNVIEKDRKLSYKLTVVSFMAEKTEAADQSLAVTQDILTEDIAPQDLTRDIVPYEVVAGSEFYDGEAEPVYSEFFEKMVAYIDFQKSPQEMTLDLGDKTYYASKLWQNPVLSPYDLSFMECYKVDKVVKDGREYTVSEDLESFAELKTWEEMGKSCEPEALKIAQQLIDTDGYVMTVTTDKDEGGVMFQRKVLGYDTAARLYVSVHKNKDFVDEEKDHIWINIGRVLIDETDELISRYDESELKAILDLLGADTTESAVLDALTENYPEMTEMCVDSKLVVNAPDDEIGMAYCVVALVPGENNPDRLVKCKAIVLVTPEYSEESDDGESSGSEPIGIKLQQISQIEDENGNDMGLYVDGIRWSSGPDNGMEQGDFPDTVSVKFDGRTYTGNYRWIRQEDYYYPKTLAFYDTAKDPKIGFYIDGNGSLAELHFYKDAAGNLTISKTGDKTADDLRDEAVRIAGMFINTDEYEMAVKTGENTIAFWFERDICGYETCSKVVVSFNTCGELMSVQNVMTSEFDVRVSKENSLDLRMLVNRLDSMETAAAMEANIKGYQPTMISYEVVRKTLVVTPDGELGMVFQVHLTMPDITLEDGTYASNEETDYFLVTLDKEE